MTATGITKAPSSWQLFLLRRRRLCRDAILQGRSLPVDGTNSKASGTLSADYDTDSKLTWHGTYSGLATYATRPPCMDLPTPWS
jgi:hypothetical protein